MRLATIMFLMTVAVSCSKNTSITNSWNSEDASKPLNKVMIVALMPEKDRDLQQNVEQKLATNLALEGFNTVSAYAQYGPKAFQDQKEKDVLQNFKTSGVDGVITISLLD